MQRFIRYQIQSVGRGCDHDLFADWCLPVLIAIRLTVFNNSSYDAAPCGRDLVRIIIVFLALTAASLVSPSVGLRPLALGVFRMAIIPNIAIPFYFRSPLLAPLSFLTRHPTSYTRPAFNIAARDCVWLC